MKVAGDIKVEPGVVIEFEQNAGIRIDDFNVDRSSFRAVGSSSKPIILRGTKNKVATGEVLFMTVKALLMN